MFYTGHVDMNFVAAVSKMSINYVCVSEPNTDRVSSKVQSAFSILSQFTASAF